MESETVSRRTAIVALTLIGLVALGAAYILNYEWIWFRGPVDAAFQAAPSSSPTEPVNLTPALREVIPEGTEQSVAEALLSEDGFRCRIDSASAKVLCSRFPLGVACAETWSVQLSPTAEGTVSVASASKSTSCL